jgi:hypothetical protein
MYLRLPLEKRALPRYSAHPQLPRKLIPQDTFRQTQPPRHSEAWSKWVQLLLELTTDFGIDPMMLVLQAYRMQEFWFMEASTQISKAILEGQVIHGQGQDPYRQPLKGQCEGEA